MELGFGGYSVTTDNWLPQFHVSPRLTLHVERGWKILANCNINSKGNEILGFHRFCVLFI